MSPAPSRPLADERAAHRGAIFVERMGPHAICALPRLVTHDFAVLSLFVSGEVTVEQRGRWRIQRGDVLLVPAGEPHRLIDAAQRDAWGVGFCVPCFASADATDAADLLAPFERVRAGGAAVIHVPDERQPYVETLVRELASATAGAPVKVPSAVARSLLTLILAEVSQAAAGGEALPAGATDLVTDSLRYIERHCLDPLTLAEVARAVNRSPGHVTTALRRATGRSVGAWIIAGRMAEARRRLLHSDERVDVVAERVGYADVTHFIRMFRREHGATPAAWRASRRSR